MSTVTAEAGNPGDAAVCGDGPRCYPFSARVLRGVPLAPYSYWNTSLGARLVLGNDDLQSAGGLLVWVTLHVKR